MNKKRSEWANEEGSALVLTLMIFLVLTVLATSISFLTVGSFRLSDINRDGTSAFYIAEAGAKSAYEKAKQDVMNKYKDAPTMDAFYESLDALFLNTNRFDKQFSDDSTANVTFTVTGSNPRKYTLTSIGSVGGKTRTVQKQFDVSWVDKGGSGGFPALPSNTALVTKAGIDIQGGSITGDIHTYSNTGKSVIFRNNGPVFNNTTLFFPNFPNIMNENQLVSNLANNTTVKYKKVDPPINWIDWTGYNGLVDNYVVPSGITEKLKKETIKKEWEAPHDVVDDQGNLQINHHFVSEYQLNLTKDIKIPTINIAPSKKLLINPNGGNRVILVDNLSVESSEIDIVGEGKVTIVVSNSLNFKPNVTINNKNNKDKLLMVYTGINAKFNYMINFYGNIIVENKNAEIEVKGSNINGIFMTNSEKKVNFVEYGSSQMQLIAPYAHVEMGSYRITGSIIAKSFQLNNSGGSLRYVDIKIPDFPGISGGATSTPTLEDLIKQSGPILEQ